MGKEEEEVTAEQIEAKTVDSSHRLLIRRGIPEE